MIYMNTQSRFSVIDMLSLIEREAFQALRATRKRETLRYAQDFEDREVGKFGGKSELARGQGVDLSGV